MGIDPAVFKQMQARTDKGRAKKLSSPVVRPLAVPVPAPYRTGLGPFQSELESDFHRLLKLRVAAGEIVFLWEPQSITLPLAARTTYTPDFPCIVRGLGMVFYETKGFRRDDAMVKIKVAARLFPWAQFVLVEKKQGHYCEKIIPP